MDPSQTAYYKLGIFGLPTQRATSRLVLLPVPWEVTTSYGNGTSRGPEAILKASPQIDLFDLRWGKAYEQGYHMEAIPKHLMELNDQLKPKAQKLIAELEENGELSPASLKVQEEINQGCDQMTDWVYRQSREVLAEGKLVGLIGGDHSTPLGAIRAVSEAHSGDFGILHIDAHLDLRQSYQGFSQSHASIMYNVMASEFKPKKLVQLGIRDFCAEEFALEQSREDIICLYDGQVKEALLSGTAWSMICRKIVESLPEKVYISFDVDGLSPFFCPNTGTPVPGGLDFDQASYLFLALHRAGKQIVGFDLNEVAPSLSNPDDEWDGNVGARLLYQLCGLSVSPSHSSLTVA